MVLINGRETSKKIKKELIIEVDLLKEKGVVPGLAVVIVGDDPASKAYVNSKEKVCKKLGLHSVKISLGIDTTEKELLDCVTKLNVDSTIHGILVQLPLPKHIEEKTIIEAINPEKDVDGFHTSSVGNLVLGEEGFIPCTPFGIVKLLEEYNIELEGKEVVVIGRSNIVGKPISLLLLHRNATVTICHSKTRNLKEHTKRADIIIAAIGKAGFLTGDMVSDGVVIIDVGINRVDGKIVGDVDFESVKDKVSYITPVPGGVGPMTITMLMENTLKAAKRISELI